MSDEHLHSPIIINSGTMAIDSPYATVAAGDISV
jgi:hypothetical protein